MFTTVLIPTLKYNDMSTGVYMISIVLFYIPLISMLFKGFFFFIYFIGFNFMLTPAPREILCTPGTWRFQILILTVERNLVFL